MMWALALLPLVFPTSSTWTWLKKKPWNKKAKPKNKDKEQLPDKENIQSRPLSSPRPRPGRSSLDIPEVPSVG
jgi:hypothetical protein